MYECQGCGRRFHEPSLVREPVEFWGRTVWEEVLGCPSCGGGYIEIEDEDEWEVQDEGLQGF